MNALDLLLLCHMLQAVGLPLFKYLFHHAVGLLLNLLGFLLFFFQLLLLQCFLYFALLYHGRNNANAQDEKQPQHHQCDA